MSLRKIFNARICVCLLSIALIASCDSNDPCNESDQTIYQTSFAFRLQSVTGEELIGVSGRLYENNDVTLVNELEMPAENLITQDDGLITFRLFDISDEANTSVEKTFNLLLPPTTANPEIDRDTLVFKYTLTANEECGDLWPLPFEIRYNDQLYADDPFPNKFTFIK